MSSASNRSRVAVATVAMAVVVTVGLSGGFPGTAVAAPVRKACALVRPAEISEQFEGAEVEKGPTPPGPKRATTCLWEVGGTASEAMPEAGSVALFLQRGRDAKDGYVLAKRQSGEGAVAVTGLGSKAFEADGVVWVLKDRTLFYVQGLFYGPGKPVDLSDRLVELARLAYARV